MIHIFTIENKSVFEYLMNLDFIGSEEISIENALGEGIFNIECNIVAEGVQTIASVREMPHSKLMWQVNWSKLTSIEDISIEEAQERLLKYQARQN
jgi:hypothetical protein